jgi:hypothetical protein
MAGVQRSAESHVVAFNARGDDAVTWGELDSAHPRLNAQQQSGDSASVRGGACGAMLDGEGEGELRPPDERAGPAARPG